jgi:hypothetical protein
MGLLKLLTKEEEPKDDKVPYYYCGKKKGLMTQKEVDAVWETYFKLKKNGYKFEGMDTIEESYLHSMFSWPFMEKPSCMDRPFFDHLDIGPGWLNQGLFMEWKKELEDYRAEKRKKLKVVK